MSNVGSIIGLVFLLLILVAYVVFGVINRKKSQEQAMKMLNELKTGDKIVTNAGIYGEIVFIKETNMGKVVTIKTGDDDGKKASFITINASVILGQDTKRDLILDEKGNVVEPQNEKTLKEEVLKQGFKPENEKEEEKSKKEDKTEQKPKKRVSKPEKKSV